MEFSIAMPFTFTVFFLISNLLLVSCTVFLICRTSTWVFFICRLYLTFQTQTTVVIPALISFAASSNIVSVLTAYSPHSGSCFPASSPVWWSVTGNLTLWVLTALLGAGCCVFLQVFLSYVLETVTSLEAVSPLGSGMGFVRWGQSWSSPSTGGRALLSTLPNSTAKSCFQSGCGNGWYPSSCAPLALFPLVLSDGSFIICACECMVCYILKGGTLYSHLFSGYLSCGL